MAAPHAISVSLRRPDVHAAAHAGHAAEHVRGCTANAYKLSGVVAEGGSSAKPGALAPMVVGALSARAVVRKSRRRAKNASSRRAGSEAEDWFANFSTNLSESFRKTMVLDRDEEPEKTTEDIIVHQNGKSNGIKDVRSLLMSEAPEKLQVRVQVLTQEAGKLREHLEHAVADAIQAKKDAIEISRTSAEVESALRQKLKEATDAVAITDQQLKQKERVIEETSGKLHDVSKKYQESQAKVQKLGFELDTAKAQLSELEHALSAAKAEQERLAEVVKAATDLQTQLEQDLQRAQQEVEDVKVASEKQAKDADERQREANERQRRLQQDVENATREIAETQTRSKLQVTAAADEMQEAIKSERKKSSAVVDELKSQLKTAQRTIEDAEAQVAAYEKASWWKILFRRKTIAADVSKTD